MLEIVFIFIEIIILFSIVIEDDLIVMNYKNKLSAQLIASCLLQLSGEDIKKVGGLFNIDEGRTWIWVPLSDSKELKDYEELYARVKSPEFKELKKTLQSRKYKDTQEYRDWKKYQKLEKDSHLAAYYRILESAELKEFLAFEKTPEFKQLGDPKAVKESEVLTRMKKYEKGNDYKIYMRFHDSYLLKEYEELKAKVATPEFIESNAFWSDNKRWDKTEESQLETRYVELCKNEDIQFYLKINAKEFETIPKTTLTLEEQFEWNTV